MKYLIGKAYIAIPSDLNRDIYIKDCYKNLHVSIRGEDGSFMNRVPISPEILNFCEFPDKPNDLGTCIVYGTDEKTGQEYIINRFLNRDEIGDNEENAFKFKRKYKDQVVQISGSSSKRLLNFLVDGGSGQGLLNIGLYNQNKDCTLNIDVAGKIAIGATGTIQLTTQSGLTLLSLDNNGNSSSFVQSSTQNKFYNKQLIINDGKDPLVLGNELKSLLNDFFDEVGSIETNTSIGLQPIVNKLKILKFKDRLDQILSTVLFTNK